MEFQHHARACTSHWEGCNDTEGVVLAVREGRVQWSVKEPLEPFKWFQKKISFVPAVCTDFSQIIPFNPDNFTYYR